MKKEEKKVMKKIKKKNIKKFEKDDEPIKYKQYMFSCVGIGLKNVARIEL